MPSPCSFREFVKRDFERNLIQFLSSHRTSNSEDYFDFQKKYVQSLPIIIVDECMNNLLLHLSERGKPDLMLETIRLMLSERTKILCIYPFYHWSPDQNEEYFIKVMELIENKKPNLMHLELCWNFLYFSKKEKIFNLIPSLKSLTLKSLFIKFNLLEKILKFFPQLENLEWIGELSSLHDFRLYCPKHESLRALRIYWRSCNLHYDIPASANEISNKFPNLEIFQTNNYNLYLFFSKRIPRNFEEREERQTSLTCLQNLYAVIPETSTIPLYSPVREAIEFVPNFLQLKHLDLRGPSVDVMSVLVKCGSQLETLVCNSADDIDLSRVLMPCPNLVHLDLRFAQNVITSDVVAHSKLRYFKIDRASDNIRLIDVLKGISCLEIVKINEWPSYSTNDLEELICALKKIKILHIYFKCNFTQNCIEQIIRRCHNLQELVLPLDNINQLEIFVQNNNYSLKLLKRKLYYTLNIYVNYSGILND